MTAKTRLVEQAFRLDDLRARQAGPVLVVPAPVDRSVRAAVAWLVQRDEARTVAGERDEHS
jgi:hypothetical protein